jgi:hypothetical protein
MPAAEVIEEAGKLQGKKNKTKDCFRRNLLPKLKTRGQKSVISRALLLWHCHEECTDITKPTENFQLNMDGDPPT